MPHADYRCPECDCEIHDHPFTMANGARASAPACLECHDWNGQVVRMEVIPAAHFDLKTDGTPDRGLQKFTVHRQVPTRDGPVQVEEVVDSLHTLRRIERDSEQRYRDGEGEPLRFRGYNQNSSNRDVNSFGTQGQIGDRAYDSGQAPRKQPNIGVARHGQRKPTTPLARVGGVSPLPLK